METQKQKRVRFEIRFDKDKDKLDNRLEELSRTNACPCLCRNQFRRYLKVRLAYFAHSQEIERSRFHIAVIDKQKVIIRPVRKITTKTQLDWLKKRKRGLQSLPDTNEGNGIALWVCQIISNKNGMRFVAETLVPETLLREQMRGAL